MLSRVRQVVQCRTSHIGNRSMCSMQGNALFGLTLVPKPLWGREDETICIESTHTYTT